MSVNFKANVLIVAFYGIAFLCVLAWLAIQPYFESKSFNECTNGNATYWDAVFTELRVQECNK